MTVYEMFGVCEMSFVGGEKLRLLVGQTQLIQHNSAFGIRELRM